MDTMLVKTCGTFLVGIDAIVLQIEVNVSMGQGYAIVGLPDAAIRESLHRTESAIKAMGFRMPRTKLVINLAPAHLRKTGSGLDLPMALGILGASEQLDQPERLKDWLFMGELGLDGSLQPIRGALPMSMAAQTMGLKGFILPIANATEAALNKDLPVFGCHHLSDVLAFLKDPQSFPKQFSPADKTLATAPSPMDLCQVRGQENVKRALEIAAAGRHNVVLIGPPGSGKTMLAKCLPSILPPLTPAESLEVTKIQSVVGHALPSQGMVTERPFRAPHHHVSAMALAGGGSRPQPGEITLAHHGVLFLDELPEFNRAALEALRQPLEAKQIHVARTAQSIVFPADFMLVAAMNPCPCGHYNHPEKPCTCGTGQVQRYLSKISGPLLDRMDLQIEVAPVPAFDLLQGRSTENSATVRERVMQAHAMQNRRKAIAQGKGQRNLPLSSSAALPETLDPAAKKLLQQAMEKMQLSARAYQRILHVSRTIADLEGSEQVATYHLAEAIQYRSLDRANWGKHQY